MGTILTCHCHCWETPTQKNSMKARQKKWADSVQRAEPREPDCSTLWQHTSPNQRISTQHIEKLHYEGDYDETTRAFTMHRERRWQFLWPKKFWPPIYLYQDKDFREEIRRVLIKLKESTEQTTNKRQREFENKKKSPNWNNRTE